MAKRGRPSKYKPEHAEQAAKLCALGATDVELADFFGVERTTIWRWASGYEDFCNALKAGKDAADNRVEQSLYHKAIGYTYDAVKIFNANGEALKVPYREHVPPDTTAAIFWLKNRRKDEWRDKHDYDHTGTVQIDRIERKVIDVDQFGNPDASGVSAAVTDGGEREAGQISGGARGTEQRQVALLRGASGGASPDEAGDAQRVCTRSAEIPEGVGEKTG